ncbi:hypothetical protein H6G54_18635 [Anabaena cylindrica FACHB-243]|uniref:Uncharacterized protein n=1 Tax=Anabaena cylindrica (strain ATCC 27899 / PCC 7122) TaxID=272123 RepID=K9ZHY3_ANACC|nr:MULTISPECIES: hypothetical protein [Anabaena]AFZ57960.1 hypothetical protein Anacy_2512 [Anabaena cylindrica PCC 7122]MBD2419685.1 hypothetical protein [Anabaena cylindrica FACHB-243]MBY5281612.1 hypothetical protein [Anabaena sp. CCAP 1446/1C]MBY5307135.1 hypothetical protein [Anabaena sp. CCAP 1446/1C]MCM2409205.1 hypothetical protein [Anabaena sp. CCAP 1446/1C]
MMIKLTKRLFVLLLVVACNFLSPGITVASANNFFTSPQVIFTSFGEDTSDIIAFSVDDLTPQERQKLQAVRQRRNKEILAVLDSLQRTQLAHELHIGSNLNQALETLDLNSEQQELINSVIEFTNLKLKGIFSRHALLDGHK